MEARQAVCECASRLERVYTLTLYGGAPPRRFVCERAPPYKVKRLERVYTLTLYGGAPPCRFRCERGISGVRFPFTAPCC